MLVHSSALLISELPFSPCALLYLIWCLAFQRESQPSVATKLVCPNFLAKSSAFSLRIGPFNFCPLLVTRQNHWLRTVSTSGALPLRRHFNFFAGLWPWQKTSNQGDLSSSLLISLVRVLLVILKISASSLWLELGGCFLTLSQHFNLLL